MCQGELEGSKLYNKLLEDAQRYYKSIVVSSTLVAAHVAHCMTLITQRRSVVKNMGCFQWRLLVCQHDNFQTSKHRTMKLGSRCIVQKSRPSSNLGVIASPGPQKCGVGYDVGKISTGCLVFCIVFISLSTVLLVEAGMVHVCVTGKTV